jgi:acetolactate synthase I/II/III large subunit
MARSLAEAGVKHAFGIPGGEILGLVDALAEAEIRFVTARHETAAGLMAEGAAAHDGAVALLVVTVGPGLSNAVNAVANAKLDRVPMLVISGAVEPSLRGSFTHQVFDQVALLAPLVKASFVAERGTVAELMERALAAARSHPAGAVHIDVPTGLFTAEEPDGAVSAPSLPVEPADSLERTSTLLQLASILRGAERPLLLCGLECTSLPVSSALRALGAACKIPSLTTYKAKGVLDELEATCLGAMGLSPRADAEVLPLLRAADVGLGSAGAPKCRLAHSKGGGRARVSPARGRDAAGAWAVAVRPRFSAKNAR